MSDANAQHRALIESKLASLRAEVAPKLERIEKLQAQLDRLDAEERGAGREYHLRDLSRRHGIDPDNPPLAKERCEHCGQAFKRLSSHLNHCYQHKYWKEWWLGWNTLPKEEREPLRRPQWRQWQIDRLQREGLSSAVYRDGEGYWGLCACSWISKLYARHEGAQFVLDYHLKECKLRKAS